MRKILTIVALSMMTTLLWAQAPTKINITLKTGDVVTYEISDIDSIWFPADETPTHDEVYEVSVPEDFSENLIMKVSAGELDVALICREYIKPAEAVMTVAYAYNTEGELDLTHGLVLDNGGSVIWNTAENTCTYTAGTADAMATFYWADGQMLSSTKEFFLPAELKAYLLVDRRGTEENKYRTVKIGTQIWMAENLNAEKYRNGATITNIPNTQPEQWRANTTGACHAFANSADYQGEYGLLYNGYAVESTAGLAPSGWDVPTIDDYKALRTYLAPNAGLKLRSAQNGTWFYKEGYEATGESGFEATAGGYYFVSGDGDMGDFTDVWYWTKTTATDQTFTSLTGLVPVRLNYSVKNLVISNPYAPHDRSTYGHYVRCIKR